MAISTALRRTFTDKLATSALDLSDAKRLRYTLHDAATIARMDAAFSERGGFKLPYLDARGRATQFYRVRYLDPPSGFASHIDPSKQRRYAQPVRSAPHAYLPNYTFGKRKTWGAIAKNAELPILLTEGELKAACAAKHGWPTVGLGGVYAWRSAKAGIPWLPELEAFAWRERQVFIVFDSDILWKPDVRRAMVDLCEALLHRGARPFEVRLADDVTEKIGLDDFLVSHGAEALEARLKEAEEYAPSKKLWAIRDRFVYVHDLNAVLDRTRNDARYAVSHFRDAFSRLKVDLQKVTPGGKITLHTKKLPEVWLDWPYRYDLMSVVYRPGAPEIIDAERAYNLWKGWGIEPKQGSVKPWKELLSYIFNSDKEKIDWFERWCAIQVQQPGVKLASAVVVWGVEQGTGKSLIGYTLRRIFGDNFAEINPDDLHSKFNEWAVGKQFIMGDEIAGGDKRADTETLKRLITQKTLRVNEKYVRSYEIDDCINYYFNSNHPDPIYIEPTDRRFFVHEVTTPKKKRTWYTDYYDPWYKGDGAAALFHHLLRLDLRGFGPYTEPIATSDKQEMVKLTSSDVDGWLMTLRDDPESFFAEAGVGANASDLWTVEQLHALYATRQGVSARLTVMGMARALKRNGYGKILNGRSVRTSRGVRSLYVVKNRERWLGARITAKAIAKHYDACFAGGHGEGQKF